jgi:hypothetical protein
MSDCHVSSKIPPSLSVDRALKSREYLLYYYANRGRGRVLEDDNDAWNLHGWHMAELHDLQLSPDAASS